MIDIENEVFTRIKKHVTAEIEGAHVKSTVENVVSHFPCVFVYESDNYALTDTATTGTSENHAVVTFTVEVYSNKSNTKKTECKKILSIVDRSFDGIGFVRIACNPVPNQFDGSIARYIARYRGTVAKNKTIFRR